MFWKRLGSFILPSPASVALAWAALFEFVVVDLLAATFALSEHQWTAPLGMVFTLALPLAAVLLMLAALREARLGARTFLWGMASLLTLVASLATAILMGADSPAALRSSLAGFAVLCLPILLFQGVVGLVLAFKAWPAFRRILRLARFQRIVEIVQARGESTLPVLAQEVGLPVEKLSPLLAELLASGELMAFVDWEGGGIYSAAALAEKQRLLAAVVQTRGQVRLEELAADLRAPVERVRTWVYHLVQRGAFHGFVDWAGGMLYARDVETLVAQGSCPHCGGKVDLAGQGVVQCSYCQVEIFV